MEIANTGVVERIARVLAGQRLSVNAGGHETSAGADVDTSWREHEDDAVAILRTLRAPDKRMAAAGDPEIWERMIAAALGIDPPEQDESAHDRPPPSGTDPLHEGP